MIVFCVLLFMFVPAMAGADIFQISEPSDSDLTSLYTRPFIYESSPLTRKVSRQVDLDNTLIQQAGKSAGITSAETVSLINSVASSPLMVYQYTSPAAADLLKFFYTSAELKLGILYSDLLGLERNTQGSIDNLLDQAELDCLQKKLNGNVYAKDAIELMLSCRDNARSTSGPLYYLNQGRDFNIIQRALDRMHTPSQVKQDILEIMPKNEVREGSYQLQGPDKRIGQVLAENRQKLTDELDALLKEYEQNKTLSAESLQDFFLPGVPFTEQSVRELLILPQDKRQMSERRLVSEASFIQTEDRYDQAVEWMRRAEANPYFEAPYKKVYRETADFLQAEKKSLEEKRGQLRGYAKAMDSLLDASEAQRLDIIADAHRDDQRKFFREDNLEQAQ